MKLRVIAEPDLWLIKEKKNVLYGETFEVSQERGLEILKATYNGKPVAELVEDSNNKESNKKIKKIGESKYE